MADRRSKPSLHQSIIDSEQDTQLLTAVLRGDRSDGLTTSLATLENIKSDTVRLADRLQAVKAAQNKAKTQAMLTASARERVSIGTALRHVEEMYQKERETQEKLDKKRAERAEENKENVNHAKKEGLMRKIADFQANNKSGASGTVARNPGMTKESERIAEDRFDIKKVRDVMINSKGEQVVLTCPITEKHRKATKKRIGNNVVLPEEPHRDKSGLPVTKKSQIKGSEVKDIDSELEKKRRARDCKTNVIRDKDNKRVYANYSGKQVKLERKNSNSEKKVNLHEVNIKNNAQKEFQPQTGTKLFEQERGKEKDIVHEEANRDNDSNEVSSIELLPEELVKDDQLEENKKKLKPKKVYLNYLEDFLVSKAKKLVYHNFDDPSQDTRVIAARLAEEVDLILKYEQKLILDGEAQNSLQDQHKSPVMEQKGKSMRRESKLVTKLGIKKPVLATKADQSDPQAPPLVPIKSTLADMVQRGMAERQHERSKLPADIVSSIRDELMAAYIEERERYRREDEAVIEEKIKIEKEIAAAEEKKSREKAERDRKKADQDKIMKMRARSDREEREKEALLKGLDMPMLLETLKMLGELKLPDAEEFEETSGDQLKINKQEGDDQEVHSTFKPQEGASTGNIENENLGKYEQNSRDSGTQNQENSPTEITIHDTIATDQAYKHQIPENTPHHPQPSPKPISSADDQPPPAPLPPVSAILASKHTHQQFDTVDIDVTDRCDVDDECYIDDSKDDKYAHMKEGGSTPVKREEKMEGKVVLESDRQEEKVG